jgi:hypothetical protein
MPKGRHEAGGRVDEPNVGAVLGDEPLHIVAPVPAARLADDGQRRRADVS